MWLRGVLLIAPLFAAGAIPPADAQTAQTGTSTIGGVGSAVSNGGGYPTGGSAVALPILQPSTSTTTTTTTAATIATSGTSTTSTSSSASTNSASTASSGSTSSSATGSGSF